MASRKINHFERRASSHNHRILAASEMKDCHWLKPELVAQIEFTEWTPDEHLRHASFAGLRDDKEARQIRRE